MIFDSFSGYALFRIVFNVGKEDILGTHEKPVRCVEYSYAAGRVES